MNTATAIKTEVDLRPKSPPVRDQGDRPTCLACATSDAHAIEHGCPSLSAEWLFFHAIKAGLGGNLQDGILFEEAVAALHKSGQPAETEWPYQPKHPDPWEAPSVTTIWRGDLGYQTANAGGVVIQLLQAGRPVVLGLKISAKLLVPIKPANTIDGDGPGFGGHAVLAVGLGTCSSSGKKILIRNSWGNSWGDGGHAWLAPSYLADKLIGFAPVTITA